MPSSVHDLLSSALAHYRADRPGQSHSLLTEALRRDPDNPQALHLKALLLAHTHPADAQSLMERSIALSPDTPDFPFNLAKLHHAHNRFDAAIPLYHRTLDLRPDHLPARLALADALLASGHPAEAIKHHRTAITLLENSPPASPTQHPAPGNQHSPPPLSQLYHAHALLLRSAGKLDDAIDAHRRAIELAPAHSPYYNDLGITLATAGDADNAVACFRESLRLAPDAPDPATNLALALRDQGHLTAALEAAHTAVRLNPKSPAALNILGNIHKDRAELDDALTCFRKATALDPANPKSHDNLLYTLLYHPDYPPDRVFEEHLKWSDSFERKTGTGTVSLSDARKTGTGTVSDSPPNDPSRKLTLAYLSPDFRHHPLGLLIEPLLAHHDHTRFTILIYSDTKRPDAITEKIKSHADFFQHTAPLSDDALADRIRRDKVDILVDLTSHMHDNRLGVFARKPAPVQASYLAYPYTTGLRNMDYLFTDKYLHPDESAWHHTETLYRLPTYWGAYPPTPIQHSEFSIQNSPSPFERTGHLTFGSLSNFCKLNPALLALWSQILRNVPTSRLSLLINSTKDDTAYATAFLQQADIDPTRVTLHPKLPRDRYLSLYDDIDIILDPYPCNGHTTSLDALFMSRPVITLPGPMPFARAGLSQLTTLRHPELIATGPDDYVHKATALATDRARLTRYHQTLRGEFLASALNDPERQTRHLETAYRTFWSTLAGT